MAFQKYNVPDLSSKLNKKKFFDKTFYPVSLFYLGMTTLRNNYRMVAQPHDAQYLHGLL